MDTKPKTPPRRRDPFSPPDWWKKWRPLRWLSGGAVLIMVALWTRNLLDGRAGPEIALPPAVPVAAAPATAPQTAAAPTAAAPAPAPTAAAPAPAPAAAAVPPAPAPAAVAAATPVSARTASPPAEVIEELPAAAPVADYQSYTRIENRSEALAAFRSYASVDEVFNGLQKAGYQPVLSSNHRKVPENLPPYDLDVIETKDYKHLGHAGKLVLQFFNDRLFEVEFEPQDAAPYREAIRSTIPHWKPGKTGRVDWAAGNLRIASSLDLAVSDVGKNLHTRPFVLWQDRRLVQQRDTWDTHYAAELRR